MKKFPRFVLLLALMGGLPLAAAAQDIIKVGQVEAGPGQKQSGFTIVPKGVDGPEINLPVTIINGTRPGPTLALTSLRLIVFALSSMSSGMGVGSPSGPAVAKRIT